MDDEKRKQVADQCKVVAHLATVLAGIHKDMAMIFEAGHGDTIAEMTGEHTAHLMEALGDILNGMDAVDEGDGWTVPILAEAHRLWPQSREAN